MAALDCSGALLLDLPFMDRAREEFIRLLTRVDEADNDRLASAWSDLVKCAAENFSREDGWMLATGHASRDDHAIQHRVVLSVMREGALQAGEGRLLQVREMAPSWGAGMQGTSRPWMLRSPSICAAHLSNPGTPTRLRRPHLL